MLFNTPFILVTMLLKVSDRSNTEAKKMINKIS